MRIGRLAVMLSGVIIALAPGPVDSAAAASWTIQPVPAPPFLSGELAAVSCPSKSFCIAVGRGPNGSLAELWTGGAWVTQRTAPAGAISALSCMSRRFCVAVGTIPTLGGRAVRPVIDGWNGSRWAIRRAPPVAVRSGSFAGVSCVSRRFCMVVGSALATNGRPVALAERWDGARWRSIRLGSGGKPGFNAVSCSSDTACMAVGRRAHGLPLAERWDGARWSVQITPAGNQLSDLTGVSCPGPSECVAVGFLALPQTDLAVALGWNGKTWSRQPTLRAASPQGVGALRVSCPSATSCAAVGAEAVDSDGDSAGFTARWNGVRWTSAGWSFNYGSLTDVSCVAPTSCVAVGYLTLSVNNPAYGRLPAGGLTLAERWDGRGWSRQKTPNQVTSSPGVLTAVSCTSATACTAVGSYLDRVGDSLVLAERWDGTTWTLESTPTALPAGAKLNSVSCPTSTTCVAVGAGESGPLVGIWSGGRWTIQPIPPPSDSSDGGLSGVSCVSPTACMAVGSSLNSTTFTQPFAEWFNGNAWTIQPVPDPGATGGLTAVSCTWATDCMAVGLTNEGARGLVTEPLVERWDDSAWTVEDAPAPANGGSMAAISCASGSACQAVGSVPEQFSVAPAPPSFTPPAPLAEGWDGNSWTIENVPAPNVTADNTLGGVSCASDVACTSVASFGALPGQSNAPQLGVEVWDGSSWTIQSAQTPSGVIVSALSGVSCPSVGRCFAVGSTTTGNVSVPLAETYG